jgi:hypothetical protein
MGDTASDEENGPNNPSHQHMSPAINDERKAEKSSNDGWCTPLSGPARDGNEGDRTAASEVRDASASQVPGTVYIYSFFLLLIHLMVLQAYVTTYLNNDLITNSVPTLASNASRWGFFLYDCYTRTARMATISNDLGSRHFSSPSYVYVFFPNIYIYTLLMSVYNRLCVRPPPLLLHHHTPQRRPRRQPPSNK